MSPVEPVLSDPFLEDYVHKYDLWIAEGRVPHAARILPVAQALPAEPWVLPSEQVLEILRGARALAVWPCVCRSHYRRCDHPLEVCLLLDQPAEALVARGLATSITLERAAEVLRETDACGLVHMGLYLPDHGLTAVCSCCACCCHELQILQKTGRRDRLARAEYMAATDPEACTHCGACVGRCAFEARFLHGDRLEYREEACLGCGLCVTACPPGATHLRRRGEVSG